MARILILSSSNLEKDPRILRQIKAWKSAHQITTCGLSPSNIKGINEFPILFSPSKRQPIFTRGINFLKMVTGQYDRITWNNSVYNQLSNYEYDIIVVNDPREMGLAVKLKKTQKIKTKIYFDLHEYFIEVDKNVIINKMFSSLTDKYQDHADILTTVNDEIAKLYEKRYNRKVSVVTNAGPMYNLSPSSIDENKISMVHHGVLNRGRKLEVMIDMMQYLKGYSLTFYFTGNDLKYKAELQELASKHESVKILPPIAYDKIVPTLNSYDIGLYIMHPSTTNEKMALPNKVFEFTQARLALAVSKNPEIKRLVDRFQNGVVSADYTAKAMADEILKLDKKAISKMKQQSNDAAKILNDGVSSKRLVEIVNELTSE